MHMLCLSDLMRFFWFILLYYDALAGSKKAGFVEGCEKICSCLTSL